MRSPILMLALALTTIACGGSLRSVDDVDEESADAITARSCRTASKADTLQCRLVGTVTGTFLDASTCVVYLTRSDTGHTYGLVESATGPADVRCPYTRAFKARTPSLGKVWTRFADTATIPTSAQRAIRGRVGFASATTYFELTGALWGAVPSDAGAPALDAILEAIDPSRGGAAALTNAIEVGDAPASLAGPLSSAVREINERRVPGTDYSAETHAIYEVFATAAKTNVVAYAVYGRGSGEPDYQDAIVIGFDVEGNRVHSVVEAL